MLCYAFPCPSLPFPLPPPPPTPPLAPSTITDRGLVVSQGVRFKRSRRSRKHPLLPTDTKVSSERASGYVGWKGYCDLKSYNHYD